MRIEWKQVVAGLAVGMVLGAGMGAWRIRALHRMPPEARQQRLLGRFSSRLGLSDDQRAKVSAILDDKRRRMEALRAEAADLAGRLLALLPEDQRSVLLLRETEGLSYEEIAETLGSSLDSVKARLRRARRTLEERLRHFLDPKDV